MIEFNCPTCQALIQVAEGAGGKKGSCPQCREKLIVPTQSGSRSSMSPQETEVKSPAVEFQSAEEPAFDELTFNSGPSSGNTDPIIQIVPPGKSGRVKRKRRRSSVGGLMVPILCAGVLFGFIGWYFVQGNAGLSPEVTGQVVEVPNISPGLISRGDVTVEAELFEKVRASLELEELALVSSTHLADVILTARSSGIVAKVKPVPEAICVSASLEGTDVADYVSDHAKELNQFRMQQIQNAANQFVMEWSSAIDKGEKQIPNLADVRDHMALASVVSGFGYHVLAWDGTTASPCVGVGSSGELFFFVRPGTKSFVIRGRDVGDDSPGFPGEIVVNLDHPLGLKTQPSTDDTPEEYAEPMMEQEESSFQEETDGEFSDNAKKMMKKKEMKDEKPMMKPDEK
ncbi:MAG: hypothetical protein P8M30_13800 [Planctomycetaceae bacterium]|jgi:hypothetical protein|nr:hypothetical protein [Planctomycetaceae bacterium]MDG2390378.1 hypothetical protein [Planctomycetaceae bacterium]